MAEKWERIFQSMFNRTLMALLSIMVLHCASEQAVSPEQVTLEDVIEALFLGTGRAGAGGGCIEDIGGMHTEGLWRTFPKGSQIRVVFGSSVAPAGRSALEREIAVFNEIIGGFFTITIDTSASEDPVAGPNEITVTDLPASQVADRCDGNSQGCAVPTSTDGAIFISVQTYQGLLFPGTAHVHEVGHALGLCHVNQNSVSRAVMANPQLGTSDTFVELEKMAIQRVFSSGLEPGATHEDFKAAGLIR